MPGAVGQGVRRTCAKNKHAATLHSTASKTGEDGAEEVS